MFEKGYTFDADGTAKGREHDMWFNGTVQGIRSRIIEFIDDRRKFVKAQVIILTENDECARTHQLITSSLTEKYGATSVHIDDFVAPYTEKPADFVAAVKSGKADIRDGRLSDGSDPFGIVAAVYKSLTVHIDYESRYWSAEFNRPAQNPTRTYKRAHLKTKFCIAMQHP